MSQDYNVTAPGHFRGGLIRGQGNFVGLFNLILFMGQVKNYMFPTPFKKYKLSISNIIMMLFCMIVYKLDFKNMSYQLYINRYLFVKEEFEWIVIRVVYVPCLNVLIDIIIM